MNPTLKQVFAAMRNHSNERTGEKDLIALPLTPQELTVVTRCLGIACETERTDAGDKQTIGSIKERIARFAERQGAWWDVEGEIVATVIKTK
jgi:hypothetical protein